LTRWFFYACHFRDGGENEMRKAFLVSEQVAIAEAIAEKLAGRQGAGHHTSKHGNISTLDTGTTRDIAAAKAGLGSGKTLEAAQAVIANGAPECWSRWC
jgi:hypothetical protein